MPAYNRADLIRASIESVLGQTYGEFELIVSDNCSNDGTAGIAREYEQSDERVRVVESHTNVGLIANWARCFAESAADANFYCLLPTDDLLLPDHFATICNLIERFPEASVIHSEVEQIDEHGEVSDPKPLSVSLSQDLRPGRHRALSDLLRRNYIVLPGVCLRRATLETRVATLFSEQYPQTHDWQAWLELMLDGFHFAFNEKQTVQYRVHAGQFSQPRDVGGVLIEQASALGRYLEKYPESSREISNALRPAALRAGVFQCLSFNVSSASRFLRTSFQQGRGTFRTPMLGTAVWSTPLGSKLRSVVKSGS